jgi:hypothetical protein
MNLNARLGVAAACAACLLGVGAQAAESVGEIKLVDGSALVSQGSQYVVASAGMQLHELDRIMVMEDSSAVLAFADGCEYRMAGSEMVTLTGQSVCSAQTGNPAAPNLTTLEQQSTSQLGGSGGNTDPGLYILAAGAAAGFIWAGTNDSGNRPVGTTNQPSLSP